MFHHDKWTWLIWSKSYNLEFTTLHTKCGFFEAAAAFVNVYRLNANSQGFLQQPHEIRAYRISKSKNVHKNHLNIYRILNKVFLYINIAVHGVRVYVLEICVRALAMENIPRSSSWLHGGGDAGMKTNTLTVIAPSLDTRRAFVVLFAPVCTFIIPDKNWSSLRMLVRSAAESQETSGCCAVTYAEFLPYESYGSVYLVCLQNTNTDQHGVRWCLTEMCFVCRFERVENECLFTIRCMYVHSVNVRVM